MQRADSLIMRSLQHRAKHNFTFVKPFIDGADILDIGAAEGWTGDLIKSISPEKNVHLLDVEDFNQTDLPLTLYDGHNFPFENDSFDTSLLLLILHHCTDPDKVLSEALRVTRRRLIITESVYHYKTGKGLLFMADNIVNGLRTHSKMALGLNFRTPQDWEDRFSQMGLSLHHKEWISKGFHKHILYVLDVNKGA